MKRNFSTIITIFFNALSIHGVSSFNRGINSSMNWNKIVPNPLYNNRIVKCDEVSICQIMKKHMKSFNNYRSHLEIPLIRRGPNSESAEARSYYNHGGHVSPAFYPAFDSLSILASLAFLAFVLQSLVSLFDRSRSIFSPIVNGRNFSPKSELPPDPMELIMLALDKYESFNKNPWMTDSNGKVASIFQHIFTNIN